MKYIRFSITLYACIIFFDNISFGQNTVINKPKHGGVLKKAGKYFLEISKQEGRLLFYFTSIEGIPVNIDSISGIISLTYEESTSKENLKPGDDNYLEVPLKKEYLEKGEICLSQDGEIVTIKFKRNDIMEVNKPIKVYKTPSTAPTNSGHSGHTH
jgi:hypothetical protein